jgi:hypothetical protein
MLEDDLPSLADFDVTATGPVYPPLSTLSSAFSVDSFRGIDTDWGDTLGFHASHDEPFKKQPDLRMKKSRSLGGLERPFDDDWDLFGDGY